MKLMRAKLEVAAMTRGETTLSLKFTAVSKPEGYPADGSDEDNSFARFTPHAVLDMSIMNPALLDSFSLGDTFYVDFTPVE